MKIIFTVNEIFHSFFYYFIYKLLLVAFVSLMAEMMRYADEVGSETNSLGFSENIPDFKNNYVDVAEHYRDTEKINTTNPLDTNAEERFIHTIEQRR